MENITKSTDPSILGRRDVTSDPLTLCSQESSTWTCIPQRPYCQGTAIPDAVDISFAMADGRFFPAELALAGLCGLLVDGNGAVFLEQNQTINIRIEVPDLLSPPSPQSSDPHVDSGQGIADGEHK